MHSERWDFDRFLTLSDNEQKEVLSKMLDGEDDGTGILQSITDLDVFMSAQAETNRTSFFVDDYQIEKIEIDRELRVVSAHFSFTAPSYDDADEDDDDDDGGTSEIRGEAVLVVQDDGTQSLEEVSAHRFDPQDDDEVDVGDFDDEDE